MHHANLLIGDQDWALRQIPEDDRTPGPDVTFLTYERMTIADARALIYDAHLRPVARAYRTFVLVCTRILPEAQNALLKLFEEPRDTVRFFVVVPYEDMLLPTLRSRLFVLGRAPQAEKSLEFAEWLRLSYRERLEQISTKLDAEDGVWVAALMRGAIAYASVSRDASIVRDTLLIDQYLGMTGGSKKMLLEHLALSLPYEVR